MKGGEQCALTLCEICKLPLPTQNNFHKTILPPVVPVVPTPRLSHTSVSSVLSALFAWPELLRDQEKRSLSINLCWNC